MRLPTSCQPIDARSHPNTKSTIQTLKVIHMNLFLHVDLFKCIFGRGTVGGSNVGSHPNTHSTSHEKSSSYASSMCGGVVRRKAAPNPRESPWCPCLSFAFLPYRVFVLVC